MSMGIQSITGHPSLSGADAVVIGAPYDLDASFGKGARHGPAAILACLERQIELFDRFNQSEPARMFKIAQDLLDDVTDLPVERMVARVGARLAGLRPLVALLGGTHAVTSGALRALAERYEPGDVTVLQLDAHLDLRDDDSDYNDVDPSRHAHACVMRRAHELGYRTCAIGVRAYAREEYEYAAAHRLPVFEWGRGSEPAIEDVLGAIATERVYLTVDVDGFDPAVMPATGTPVPGGVSWAYGTALLRRVCRERQVVGFDIVEVAPDGRSGLTEYAAAQLCYDLLGEILLRRSGSAAHAGSL